MHCDFVPPYLLRRIATHADNPEIGAWGEATLRLDNQLRARREEPPRLMQAPHPAADAAARVIHSAGNTEQLPGDVVRGDTDPPTGDLAVDEAFDSSGQVWDLFAEQFDRRSVDGKGTTLSVTVHYGSNYDNAFWDGTQLVFGDGDGQIFDRFTKPMDVMAHEFTHGVTQFTAGLTYQRQSGALNESVSDVFASMTKQKSLGQTADEADWLIGEGLFLSGINAKALRSMKEPGTAYDDPQLGKDPQVASMADYVETDEDSGGVHINSGIPNRAFALAAVGIGGNSWEQAGHVWYGALTGSDVNSETDFVGFARATVSSANRLFGDDQRIGEQVRAAWIEVGVLSNDDQAPLTGQGPTAPSPGAPVSPGGPGTSAGYDAPSESGQRVAVRRTGGFAGGIRAGELDLDSHPLGSEVRELLTGLDPQRLMVSPAAPDRFIYTLEFGAHRLTVPEQDLTPELHRVVQIVLGDQPGGGRALPPQSGLS